MKKHRKTLLFDKINIIYNSKYLTVAPKKFINMYIDKTIN